MRPKEKNIFTLCLLQKVLKTFLSIEKEFLLVSLDHISEKLRHVTSPQMLPRLEESK